MSEKAILIKQLKAITQSNPKQKATLKAIGLRGLGSTIVRKDTRAIRGMLHLVQSFISAEQMDAAAATAALPKKTRKLGYKIG